jgi:8-oxo-dGTP diphosphatase
MIEAACAVIFHQGKILGAQRSEKMRHPLKWEFPGGKLELNESPEECVIREIKEELLINIQVVNLISESIYEYDTKYIVKLYAFICHLENEMPILTEHKQFQWFDKANILSYDWVEGNYAVIDKLL